jgi:hypothetical protein
MWHVHLQTRWLRSNETQTQGPPPSGHQRTNHQYVVEAVGRQVVGARHAAVRASVVRTCTCGGHLARRRRRVPPAETMGQQSGRTTTGGYRAGGGGGIAASWTHSRRLGRWSIDRRLDDDGLVPTDGGGEAPHVSHTGLFRRLLGAGDSG